MVIWSEKTEERSNQDGSPVRRAPLQMSPQLVWLWHKPTLKFQINLSPIDIH
jgi:hypothetical protein